MNFSSRKFIFINLIASLVLLVIIGSTVLAWYVNRNQTESVDVTTDGIVVTYTINEDNTTLNTDRYSVSNLVFFDIDSEYEGKYFTTCAVMLQLDVKNISKKNVDITVEFVPDTTLGLTDPYATCIICDDDDLDSSSYVGSVTGYITTNSLERTLTVENIATNGVATFYVYFYGVQPDDDATNAFLSETYDFTLLLNATLTPGQDASIDIEE